MSDKPGLTDAEKLAALETYLKTLEPIAKALRAKVTADMGARHVERVGAYLRSLKLASVGYSKGRKTAKVTDAAAALKWCMAQYPEAIVQAVNPAFLKSITDHSAKVGIVGEAGVDPHTGEELTFIEVVQGNPYVTVTTTEEGVDRMAGLAGGFVAMLEAAPDEAAREHQAETGGTGWPSGVSPRERIYDPAFADRLENGAYER